VKILLVSRGVIPVPVESGAGAEAHMYNLANAMGSLGHEVHYVTNVSHSKENAFDRNVIIHEIGSAKILANKSFYAWTFCHVSGNVRAFQRTLKILRKENHGFDVIHSHGNLASLLLSQWRKTVPLVYTVHDTPPYSCSYSSLTETIIHHVSFQVVDLNAWRKADRLVSVSKNLKKEIMRKGIPSEKISVVHSGVDDEFLKEINQKKSRDVLRKKYRIANHYCLFVGRLAQRKGLDYLLHALERSSNMKCIIVGDGPQRESLLSLASTLGLQDQVIFTGFVPQEELKHFYAGADFFVLPSLAEGLPLVVLEALACGTPVIASDVAGIPEIVSDGFNGLIVPPKDVKALSEAMQKLASNLELRNDMGKNARRTVDERFGWVSIAKEVLKVYGKTCR
jgi:glycosyltransferase involved in cell wall biosynthesis